ncbi:MAG: helix-hairpin-helix domain-containing protein [Pseudomonadota bacterium]
MNPAKVRRDRLERLEDLPNIGPAMARDLLSLGIRQPTDLAGQDAYVLYEQLCRQTGLRHDPCVIDVFLSVVRFMDGGPALPWWDYTAERKRALAPSGQR